MLVYQLFLIQDIVWVVYLSQHVIGEEPALLSKSPTITNYTIYYESCNLWTHVNNNTNSMCITILFYEYYHWYCGELA